MKIYFDPLLKKFRVRDSSSSGGSLVPTNITYATLSVLYNAGTMTLGWYNITDVADQGLIIQAISASRLALNATGKFLVPDFNGAGDYSGVVALTGVVYAGTDACWRDYKEITTVTYSGLAGGTFSPGDTVTDTTTGAAGEVVSDNGVNSLTLFLRTAGSFTNGNTLDNGAGVTATIQTETTPTLFNGIVVFWNGLHYQVVNELAFQGQSPDSAPGIFGPCYQELPKANVGMGYILNSDYIEYDFPNNFFIIRKDVRGNSISGTSIQFQWGNDNCELNECFGLNRIRNENQLGDFSSNKIIGTRTSVLGNVNESNVKGNVFNGMGKNLSITTEFLTGELTGCVVETNSNVNFSDEIYQQEVLRIKDNSSFSETVNISSLTTLTFSQKYLGVIYLNSTNAAESINLFANFPVNHPVRFYPDSGLTVTFIHNTGGNQPRCEGGSNVVLNGTNGDWVEFVKNTDGFIYQSNIYTG